MELKAQRKKGKTHPKYKTKNKSRRGQLKPYVSAKKHTQTYKHRRFPPRSSTIILFPSLQSHLVNTPATPTVVYLEHRALIIEKVLCHLPMATTSYIRTHAPHVYI